MEDTKHILVVDDEPTIREVVRRYLEREGFRVTEAADGYLALDEIDIESPDLIILDLMLPGIDGLTLTHQLRQSERSQIPIIMLTAKGEPSDRIRGLDIGADDYLVKPFSPRELVSRVNAIFRRTGEGSIFSETKLDFAGLSIDPMSYSVHAGGKPVSLSSKEFELLMHFATNPARVYSRMHLLDQVWGIDFFGDPSTVTVHIRRLREKIEPDPSSPVYIHTVWGVGYKFDPPKGEPA